VGDGRDRHQPDVVRRRRDARGDKDCVCAAREPARGDLFATALLGLQRVFDRDEVQQSALRFGDLREPVPAGEVGSRRSVVRHGISPG